MVQRRSQFLKEIHLVFKYKLVRCLLLSIDKEAIKPLELLSTHFFKLQRLFEGVKQVV